jgi:3-methyladenine DNA glycosylase AlkD
MTARDAQQKVRGLADSALAASSVRFFKTGPGQYGENDLFLGLRTATLRQLAREYHCLPFTEVEGLLQSPYHEERALALLIMVRIAGKAADSLRKEIYESYLANTQFVNNWDLVDVSAPALVGGYLVDRSRTPLVRLARSKSLWERRIAIVATQHFIRRDDFPDTLKIAKILLKDSEDLIHKAVGWMLREVGERDQPTLEIFLLKHYARMPRTMLRYSIEKFAPAKRQAYLKGLV